MIDPNKEINNGNPGLAPGIKDQIIEIVRQTPSLYPPEQAVLGETDNEVIAANLSSLLDDPDVTTTFTLEGEEGEMVTGFSLAIPIGRMDKTRREESSHTAYIYYAAIRPELRGRGLVEPLLEKTYAQLKQLGYKFVEADALLADGWADKFERNHKDAIQTSYEHNKWGLGQQRFFHMVLEKLGAEEPK